MINIPSSVKVGGFNWAVKQDQGVSREGNVYGSTHFATQTIFLDPSSTDQKKEQCLIHEIMHAIWWQSGLGNRVKDKDLEEDVIAALSFGIHQVIRDNPGLLTDVGF